MIGGVNFQPGQMSGNSQPVRPKAGNSVQEAIKILSLRLPKQVGPNALAPSALLNAQGSGGNPRVDSVVNTVLSRMMPTGAAPAGAPPAPVLGPSAGENNTMPVGSPIRVDGNTRPPGTTPLSSMMGGGGDVARSPRVSPVQGQAPGITFENPAPPNMNPNEWTAPTPPPPPGSSFDGSYTRWPLAPAPVQGVVPDTPLPPQRFDNNPPARPSEGSDAPAPTQDPWADLMAYIRRKGETPMGGGEQPNI